MYNSAKKGWYKLIVPDKYIPPVDKHMQSYIMNESGVFIEYKSSLELNMFKYCDYSKFINSWGTESFPIKYIKPTDGKTHRYYIDVVIEFSTGQKLLVEVKSSSETKPPKKPKKITAKSDRNYQRAVQTYAVNTAKWSAAKEFAKRNNMDFTIITEKELK